ncbi:hypothetical protein C8F01DRAFT_1141382 [Mycena amicta]|nr:hypothetical protein C8F01DRAFT_1141382 [Mycena amicta]
MRLPQELLDAIVNEVEDDDVDTLRSCCRASRCFVSSSQRALFASVDLRRDPRGNISSHGPATKLSALFVGSPHIALHLQELYIGLVAEALPVERTALEEVLGLVPNLRRISIRGSGEELWGSLTARLFECFLRSRLTGVYFVHVYGIPLALLRAVMSFQREVFLGLIRLAPSDDVQISRRFQMVDPPYRLHRLILGPDAIHPMEDLIQHFVGEHVYRLEELEILGVDYPATENLLAGSCKTLQHLLLRLRPTGEEIHLAIPRLPRLRNLCVVVDLEDDHDLDGSITTTLPRVLADITKSSPCLTALRLDFVLMDYKREPLWDIGAVPAFDAPFFPITCRLCVDSETISQHDKRKSRDALFIEFTTAMAAKIPGPHAARMLFFGLADEQHAGLF